MKRVCNTGVNKFWLPAIDAVLCSPGIVVPSLRVSVLSPIPGAAFPAEECSQSGISAPVAGGLASLTSMSLQSYFLASVEKVLSYYGLMLLRIEFLRLSLDLSNQL